jgi:diaminohydroxyphosphoribosylaminopyrimidine deaminase / 5-amino-6-(5-phosphoribosylamino)uracil reductase
VRRIMHGLPWVIAKGAQTADGHLVTRPGEPRWISCQASRRRVHRLRARVDAILTGMGTVLADDPMLTARGVRVHRVARRVIVDPSLELPPGSALVRTAREAPVMVMCGEDAFANAMERRRALEAAGVQVVLACGVGRRMGLTPVLARLRNDLDATTVLLECGPKTLRQAFEERVVDAAHVHIPRQGLTPGEAHAAVARAAPALADGSMFSLCRVRRSDADHELVYWRITAPRSGVASEPRP